MNCVVPVRVRLVGRPTDDDLLRLEDTVARLVTRQLRVAQRALQGGGYADVGTRQQVRDPYDPAPPAGILPTRQQLNAEVDRMFREFFPDAPRRLDPNDPKQGDLVDTWLGVRDGILDQWTDQVFFSFFPNAPKKLDPSKSEDAQLIDFWTDIRHQIRDRGPGRYCWGPQAPAPAPRRPRTPATTTAVPAPPLRVRDIHNFGGGRLVLDFDTDPGVEAAAALVFPTGTPRGVTVSVYGPRQILFEHITLDSLASMPWWLARAFMQATQGVEDDPKQRPAARPPSHGKPHPEVDIDTPEELKAWAETTMHITHWVGHIGHMSEFVEYLTKAAENIAYRRLVAEVGVDVVERAARAGAALDKVMRFHRIAAIAEVAGIVLKAVSILGDIALIIWVGYQVIEAFKAEKESEKRFGYLYGFMWQALDEPDHIRVYNAPGITYSEKELREAFVEGVAEGRAKGRETEVRNGIRLWVAASAVESGIDMWAASSTVISEIYSGSQRTKLRFPLGWPTPFPYAGIVGLLSNP